MRWSSRTGIRVWPNTGDRVGPNTGDRVWLNTGDHAGPKVGDRHLEVQKIATRFVGGGT